MAGKGPLRRALIAKSREAALTAVQTYNNPLVRFKSETYIVLMTIAWTYLMHAYYARELVDYRYLDKDPASKRKYQRTAEGRYKYWELATCLTRPECPFDKGTINNLRFLLGLRHEIEHHRPPHLDEQMSGRYVACALNFEYWLTQLFGDRVSLADSVAIAVQFRDLSPAATTVTAKLPPPISRYIAEFDKQLSSDEYDDPRFSVRLVFQRKLVNRPGQADRAIEFIRSGDPGSEDVPPERVVIKDTEKRKHRPTGVVKAARDAGYAFFGMHEHTLLWHRLNAKDPSKGFGVDVEGQWYWYDSWIDEVLRQCEARAARKTSGTP